MSEKQTPKPENTENKLKVEAAKYEGKTPEKILKDKSKVQKKYRILREVISSQVSRSTALALRPIIKHTNKIRSKFGVVDKIYKLEDEINRKFFKVLGDKFFKEIKDKKILEQPDGLNIARKMVLEKFATNRKAYIGFITTLFTTLALDKNRNTPQINLEHFVKSFENILGTVGIVGSFENLMEVANLTESFNSGKNKNALYSIHQKLAKKLPLSSEELQILATKFKKSGYDQFENGIVGKYERMVLPMISMALSNEQRYKVLELIISQAEKKGDIIFLLKDWYIAGLLSKSQTYRLLDQSLQKIKNSTELKKFYSEFKQGLWDKDKENAQKFVERQMRNQRFTVSGRNFALQKLNIFTVLGYEIVWSGAMMGVLAGLFSGTMRSIQSKDPSEFFAVLSHPTFLGCVGVMAGTTEWATQHKRKGKDHEWSNVSKGAISTWLESFSQGGKKAKEIAKDKNQKKLLWDMTNYPDSSEFFLKNYEAINRYMTAKTKGGSEIKNPAEVLSVKKLSEITKQKIPSQIDGMSSKNLAPLFYRFWFVAKYDLKISSGKELKNLYQQTLSSQGVVAKKNKGKSYETYNQALNNQEIKDRKQIIGKAFSTAKQAVDSKKSQNKNS